MNDNPMELVLKSKGADEVLRSSSSNVYGWVFLALLLILVGIGLYKLYKKSSK